MSRTGSHAPAAGASDGSLLLPFAPGMDARVAAARGDKHPLTARPSAWEARAGVQPVPLDPRWCRRDEGDEMTRSGNRRRQLRPSDPNYGPSVEWGWHGGFPRGLRIAG